ncbi:MFS transporter [Aestuariimicrobium soli]|uniref:MFS transporter n=1 Tax=Aestuariimicrobium soli TaxID=2035834 RepID=UPI003EB9531D
MTTTPHPVTPQPVNPSQARARVTRTDRLDRLPFNRRHAKLLVGSGLGWALDAMDVGLISFVMVALAAEWKLSPGQLSWIASIGFVGMAIGASLGGLLADKIGRRQVFALTLLVYGVATGASALAWSVGALIVLRFIVGLGLGAELPVASTLVSEYAPRRIRGRVVVMLEAFWALGWIMASLIGYLVIPNIDNGWRWALLVGIVPAAYALIVRYGLPESVRFLESKGRHDEAEAAVRRYEEPSGVPAPSSAERADSSEITAEDFDRRTIWSPGLRSRTIALWVVWFCINLSYYGAFIWLPSLLVKSGHTVVKSFEYTMIITLAQLPGYAVAAVLIEIWGRRATLATFLAGSALSAAAFGFADSTATILVAGCFLSFFNLGAWGALYAVGPELYPTRLRGAGTGAAAAFGRIASMIAPLSVPIMLANGGLPTIFTVFAAAFVVAAVAAVFLPEYKNRELTE